MRNNYQSDGFKKLLNKLQQESWQLELIISGFAIYGLFLAIEPIEIETLKAMKNDEIAGIQILSTLLTIVYILTVLLLTHVILRGLWIGAIGLRYVSGDIEYDSLNYTEKFTTFLQKKVGSFDRYISRLENICSTLFALAFLMVFFFISYFMVITVFMIIINFLIGLKSISETLSIIMIAIFSIIYILSTLLYMIDFLGGGILKKFKFSSKVFFPIYRVFGFITLSFLYRPLLYNFLDQKKARWIAILIFPTYFFLGIFLSSFGKQNSNYLIVNQNTSSIYTNKENYDDELIEETDLAHFVSIPSKIIEKPYLPVFIEFNSWMEDALIKNDSTLAPKKDKRGYGFDFKRFIADSQGGKSITIDESSETMDNQHKYLKGFNEVFQVHIDSTIHDSHFGMTTNKKGRFGFEAFLDIENLNKGKHLLRFVGPNKKSKDKLEIDTIITIPFWYFPQIETKTNHFITVKKDSMTN